jgi:hypothetical protein
VPVDQAAPTESKAVTAMDMAEQVNALNGQMANAGVGGASVMVEAASAAVQGLVQEAVATVVGEVPGGGERDEGDGPNTGGVGDLVELGNEVRATRSLRNSQLGLQLHDCCRRWRAAVTGGDVRACQQRQGACSAISCREFDAHNAMQLLIVCCQHLPTLPAQLHMLHRNTQRRLQNLQGIETFAESHGLSLESAAPMAVALAESLHKLISSISTKLKVSIGFVQVFSSMRISISVPWPESVIKMMAWMKIIDVSEEPCVLVSCCSLS